MWSWLKSASKRNYKNWFERDETFTQVKIGCRFEPSVWINLRTSPTRDKGDQLLLLLGNLIRFFVST